MTAEKSLILVVTGLQREADIASGQGVTTLCSGGRPVLLRERLMNLHPARLHEGRDPAQKDWLPAFAGMSGGRIGGILSFGLAGGLAPGLKPGDIVLATHVRAGDAHHDVTLDWHDAMASKLEGAVRLHRGLIAGMDRVLTKSADKVALHSISNALAVDMESHIAAAFAREHGLPFASLRAISDPATRCLPGLASDALTPDGNVAPSKVIGGLLRRPGQLPALIAAGIDSERAFASLRRCRRLLGPLFGFRGADL
ncbi:MAG: nucleoside phosphorylase [Pseudorhodoplanes sp.]|uniref:phosphorylase family protein n=1 Tax=Pseudorhodoplanes sp. TaxID=1934341 RepID=UPI003D12DBD4